MNCRRFEEELENRGDLKALEADAAFGEHLRNCPACRTRRAEYARLFQGLSSDQIPMPDDAYWASFPARVREQIEKNRARPGWRAALGWSLPAATLVLVVGIAVFVSRERPRLADLTAGEAFSYAETPSDSLGDIPLPQKTLASVAAQAEEELVGTSKVEELVYTLSDEQLKSLEEKLTDFKM